MEHLSEALSRVSPDMTTVPVYQVQTDELTILFGGKIWPREILDACWMEIDMLLKGERSCQICNNYESCPMLPPGWQTFYDIKTSEKYPEPVFRVRPCRHLMRIEQQKKEKQLFTPSSSQQEFGTFHVTRENELVLNKCEEYARNYTQFTDRGLLLMGSNGTGKSHLATSIAKNLMRRGHEVGYIKATTLLDEIRASYDGEGAQAPVFARVQKRFVVFDDLGAERVNEWVEEQFFKVFDYRCEHCLPTVITSNLNIPALEEKIGRRTVDRILGMCDVVTVGGESYRRLRPVSDQKKPEQKMPERWRRP